MKGIRILAVALLLPVPGHAELFKNLAWEGRFDFAGVAADNVTDFDTNANPAPAASINRDKIGSMQHRIMLTALYDLLDDVHGRATARKNNRVYGNGSESSQDVQDNVFLDEASVRIDKLVGEVDLTMGRQFYGEPGDMIAYYGPRGDYGLNVDAIDAVRMDWKGETLTATALFGKDSGNGNTLAPAQNGTADVRGLILGARSEEKGSMHAYLWNAMSRRYSFGVGVPPQAATTGGRNDNLWVAGLKGKLLMGPAWLAVEGAHNFGSQRISGGGANVADSANYVGWAARGDLGVRLEWDGVGVFAPWAHGAIGSGRHNNRSNKNENFTDINTDYRPGALYGRFHGGASVVLASAGSLAANDAASNGLSNRVVGAGGLKFTPDEADKLTVGASYWDIRRHRSTSQPNFVSTSNGHRRIGSELDVDATWRHSDNVQLVATYAQFMPGSHIEDAAQSTHGTAGAGSAGSGQGTNMARMGAFDVRIKWGGQQ